MTNDKQPMTIYHITTNEAWETAVSQDEYRADSLETEGFIHCSTAKQVLAPANELFHGQHGLILLCINEEQITQPVIYEDLYSLGIDFPHIYGPLNPNAVIETVDFPPNADGSFSLPPELTPNPSFGTRR